MEGFTQPEIAKLALDVTSDENVQSVIKTIIEREGHIDMVVNNAGANCPGIYPPQPSAIEPRVLIAL